MADADKRAEDAEKAVRAEERNIERAEARLDKAEARLDKAELRRGHCPHCDARLVVHEGDNPFKDGAQHCNDCGCCFKDGELREGHQPCSRD